MAIFHSFIIFLFSFILHTPEKEFKNYGAHPTYISVTQIDYDSKDKFATILCKAFTDDLVLALQKKYFRKENISNPVDAKKLSSEIEQYIALHLQIKINGERANFSMINYKEDKENNSVAIYFKSGIINNINKIEISNTIFYELYPSQIEIIYVTINGNRKSNKLRNPESEVSFEF